MTMQFEPGDLEQRHCVDPVGSGHGRSASPPPGSRVGANDDSHPVRVLIVDDNLGLAENIAEILESEGHSTDVAGSAEEALRKALTEQFKVVVTDFRLPGMNGIDFVRTLRRQRLNVVAIVISAYLDEGAAYAAKEVGARFLEKPIDLSILNQLVRGPEGSA